MTDAPTEREEEGAWAKLRRRKVVQWGLAYAAGAWALLQVFGFAADAFVWPAIAKRLAMLALVLGLPIVFVLAWYHGDRGEQRVTRTEFAMLTLLLLLGGGALWLYGQRTGQVQTTATTMTPATTIGPSVADARPSIAVLPFENRSDAEKDAFFVDGIHDDILTQLSKVSGLKVISRTSVEQFRDTKLPTKAIAEQLGVKSILEGGVQRAGDRVRINVQLIDAESDAHLWAESYDRELTAANIFAIQSEIASAIAGALKAALTAAERARVNAVPTRNLAAWEALQLGRQRMANRSSKGLEEAEASFKQAIHLDPTFAQAYAGLADVLVLQVGYADAPQRENFEKAEDAIQRALALDPNLADAYGSAGLMATNRGQADRAESLFRRAAALDPNYAPVHQWLGGVLADQGRLREGLAELEEALALDPLSPMINWNLADTLAQMSRYDEAEARFRRIIEIDPTMRLAYGGLANLKAYGVGQVAEGVVLQEKAVSLDPGNAAGRCFSALLRTDLGDDAGAASILESAWKRWPDKDCVLVMTAYRAAPAGDRAGSLVSARKVLAMDRRNQDALRLLRDADLAAGRPDAARGRYAAAYPELFVAGGSSAVRSRWSVALDIVPVLQRTGEADRANALLDLAEEYGQELPKPGFGDRRLADARIAALRGDRARALAELRDAINRGWRGPGWRYYRDQDPALDPIRSAQEFKAAFADIERDMARQRAELAKRPKDAPLDVGVGR